MNIQRSIKLLTVAAVMGISTGTVLFPTKALAWHPQGKISKFVANETTGGPSVDANTSKTGVAAKPGDILRYTITVRNDGEAASNGYNDLAFVVITDNLPAGVALQSNPAQRKISETIPGVVKPGKSITKEYKVTVTATEAGDVTNTACFTGDSTNKDKEQQGCDDAIVTVKVEKKPEVPKPPVTPQQPKAPELPKSLPSTGPEAAVASVLGITALGYATVNYRRSKNALSKTHRK